MAHVSQSQISHVFLNSPQAVGLCPFSWMLVRWRATMRIQPELTGPRLDRHQLHLRPSLALNILFGPLGPDMDSQGWHPQPKRVTMHGQVPQRSGNGNTVRGWYSVSTIPVTYRHNR